MSRTVPSSFAAAFEKAYATNSTASSFAARGDSTTEPANGSGVIDLRPTTGHPVVPTWVELVPYGVGDADDVFNLRVYGVREVAGASWTHVPLLEVACTLGTKTGVASGAVLDTEKYCDTLTAAATSFGVADNSYRLVSPADNSAGRILLDTEGYQKLRVDIDLDTGSPTSANCLWARV